MIERYIVQKSEEAKTQGWRQRILARFLDTSFRLARICGLTDTGTETTDIPFNKEGKNWSEQVVRLIDLGFHAELGISEDEYRTTIPAFQPQPAKFKGRFDFPVLIDPRVSLQRQLDLHKVLVNHQITEADLTRLSIREANKQHIPKEPYQLWVKVELRPYKVVHRAGGPELRTVGAFTYDERGLTTIEGLTLLRESPNILYNGFFGHDDLEPEGMLLLDSYTGENQALTLQPIGSFRLPNQVAVLTTAYAAAYTCSYNLVSCGKIPKK